MISLFHNIYLFLIRSQQSSATSLSKCMKSKANVFTLVRNSMVFCTKTLFVIHLDKKSGVSLLRCASFLQLSRIFEVLWRKNSEIFTMVGLKGLVELYRRGVVGWHKGVFLVNTVGNIVIREHIRQIGNRHYCRIALQLWGAWPWCLRQCYILCSGSEIFRLENTRKGVNL